MGTKDWETKQLKQLLFAAKKCLVLINYYKVLGVKSSFSCLGGEEEKVAYEEGRHTSQDQLYQSLTVNMSRKGNKDRSLLISDN